ncbi:MAG: hypothetical protein LBT57_02525 [Puniceicoccales bacterium]|jgi:hypothetical protein|nr:hypothetical protein [Puniceicoccales bacterium]
MKNILFWSLIQAAPGETQVPEAFESGELEKAIQDHAIQQLVLFAVPEWRLVLEEFWMRWQQKNPDCELCVEYIPTIHPSCGVLKAAMQLHLPDRKIHRGWCSLSNSQSSHEAFKQALDALSEDLKYQIVWIDLNLPGSQEEKFSLPKQEEEDPYHWSIFEKVRAFDAEKAPATAESPKAS